MRNFNKVEVDDENVLCDDCDNAATVLFETCYGEIKCCEACYDRKETRLILLSDD